MLLSCSFSFWPFQLCCGDGGAALGPLGPDHPVIHPVTSTLRCAGGSPLPGVTGETLCCGPLHPQGPGCGGLRAPGLKVATKPAPPLWPGLWGTCFPGLAGQASPGPPSPGVAGSGFPTFWFSHLPRPSAPALRPSPHQPVPELDPREGECWKRGQGGGAGRLLRQQHREGAGIEESPAAPSWNGGRLLPLSLFLPSQPQGLAPSRSKLERPTSLAAPQRCLQAFSAAVPSTRNALPRLRCQCKPHASSRPEPSAASFARERCPVLHQGPASLLQAASPQAFSRSSSGPSLGPCTRRSPVPGTSLFPSRASGLWEDITPQKANPIGPARSFLGPLLVPLPIPDPLRSCPGPRPLCILPAGPHVGLSYRQLLLLS